MHLAKKPTAHDLIRSVSVEHQDSNLDKIQRMPNKELIRVFMVHSGSSFLQEAAKAELQIRQTKAIGDFNNNSAKLTWIIIFLTMLNITIIMKDALDNLFFKIFYAILK